MDELRKSTGSVDVDRVISRAKRMMILAGVLTTMLWVLTAIGFALLVYSFFHFFYPVLAEWALQVEEQGLSGRIEFMPRIYLTATYIWTAVLGLAAISTICFIVTSRRAALRQIQKSLAEISKKLEILMSNNEDR